MAIFPSNTGGNRFPDVAMIARAASSSEERYMKAKLFTGVSLCLISEHVVTDRWGIGAVDASKRQTIIFSNGDKVETLGQLLLFVQLAAGTDGSSREPPWEETTFEVVPISHARHQYDVLLSDDLTSAFGTDCISMALRDCDSE